jgi:hypothetical protein
MGKRLGVELGNEADENHASIPVNQIDIDALTSDTGWISAPPRTARTLPCAWPAR